jgi:hypothetical protein
MGVIITAGRFIDEVQSIYPSAFQLSVSPATNTVWVMCHNPSRDLRATKPWSIRLGTSEATCDLRDSILASVRSHRP